VVPHEHLARIATETKHEHLDVIVPHAADVKAPDGVINILQALRRVIQFDALHVPGRVDRYLRMLRCILWRRRELEV
jgi:hypothetical protein